jgi:hypothetical protein
MANMQVYSLWGARQATAGWGLLAGVRTVV